MQKRIAILLMTALVLVTASGCGAGQGPASGADTPAAASQGSAATDGSAAAEAEPEPESPASSEPAVAEEPVEPEPDNDCELDTPEIHGMNPALLEQLRTAVADEEIYSIVTVKDGYLIDEFYKDGYHEASVFTLHSCSKSFTGALIGLAIDQGLMGGVDDKLAGYLPQLADYADEPQKQEITIGQLLTHTSGLEWHEWGGNSSSWRPFRSAENWVDYILGQPMVAEPGTYFAYTTGGSHLLAAALQEATGKSALEYGEEYVFEPMGMDSVEWEADAQGVIDGGNGIAMTARDAVKFGQLYLDGGRWRGRQILPEEWVALSTARHVEGADNAAAYGYQWWIRTCGGYETYYAMGAGGQFIFVVPELDLVTAITSRSRDTYQPRTYFIDYILAACSGEAAQ